MHTVLLALLLAGCTGSRAVVGDFSVQVGRDGTIAIDHAAYGTQVQGLRLLAGTGSATVSMQFGAFRFDDVTEALATSTRWKGGHGRSPIAIDASGPDGEPLGTLVLSPGPEPDSLALDWTPADPGANRLGLSADCDDNDHFLGLGEQQQDVDHVGQAFPLWVQEPGVGKSTTDDLPQGWPLVGPRHATSYPVPFLLRPTHRDGWLVDTSARVDVDLCASDPSRFSAVAWTSDPLHVVLFAGATPLDPVRSFARSVGTYSLPPPWVFAPWNDAVRGEARVRYVADRLRAFGAPSSVIWTEDWKGAIQGSQGYHLTGEWTIDRTLYPDAESVAAELKAKGFQWLAYFSPFVEQNTQAWQDAVDADVLLHDDQGGIDTFTGVNFDQESELDLTNPTARAWARDRMQRALDIGFSGWMADYAEWTPPDAVLSDGEDPMQVHDIYPQLWQQTNLDVLQGTDSTFFVRSGWTRTASLVPVVWGGDQRTDFETDDGFPTVVAMGLGLGASGVPVFTHDVAGYQSIGNPPSTKELWFRWAWLGAFTPVLRTHHGAFDTENWQFDSDDETTAFWAEVGREHMLLFPYLYGLAAKAAADGTPLILPPALVFGSGDWGRMDGWMLGNALFVAPVLQQGATGRQVDLPKATTWYDWWTHAPAQSGWYDAPIDHIPVFAAAHTTVPVFAEAPDTLVPTDDPSIKDLADVDGARVVYLFGGGGPFTEADGTTYAPSGTATGAGEATQTLTSGTVQVAGVSLRIDGTVQRTYTVEVIP